ncbi:uncharacterized protein [Eucyclogobius newberryi]|uniref:uncharacterized protein n=1 Tax=Eucyclogobius newberryi TaxID=166745 RepID=UPI003B5B015D
MMHRLAPLILLSTITLSQTDGDGQITRTLVRPGANFTMSCSVDGNEAGLLYLYKVGLDSLIQTVAAGSYDDLTLQENFNNKRFNVTKTITDKISLFTISILNVTREDGASYVCQAGSSYKMTFVNTTLLIILDEGNHTFNVKQIPWASAPLGASVKLNCSLVSKNSSPIQCPSKRSVHWFRSGAEESPAHIIYTYEEQTEERDKRSCFYSLTATIQDSNDTGTYYCAVATCGHVLFGPGTTVTISSATDLQPVCAALGVLLLCSAVINAVMFYRYRKAAHHKEEMPSSSPIELLDTSLADQSNNEGGKEAAVNYVALEFPLRKVKRSKMKNGTSECLYSATRDYQ